MKEYIEKRSDKKYYFEVDFIRALAIFFVFTIHGIGRCGFNSCIIEGKSMYFASILRIMSVVCVPLFIMLTGYLQCNKKFGKGFYLNRRIFYILFVYVMSVIITTFVPFFLWKSEKVPIIGIIKNILGYEGYAWYINMYLGLWILIPFLNILWNNLENKEQEKGLLIILFVLTALPSMFNIYDFKAHNWYMYATESINSYQVVPDWWMGIYPLTYYYWGAYFRKHEPNSNWYTYLGIFFMGSIIVGTWVYLRNKNGYLQDGISVDWGSATALVLTVAIFAFCISIREKLYLLPSFLKKMVHLCAQLSLGAYLCSVIFDIHFYEKLTSIKVYASVCLHYLPLLILVVAGCSFIISAVIELLWKLVDKGISLGKSAFL